MSLDGAALTEVGHLLEQTPAFLTEGAAGSRAASSLDTQPSVLVRMAIETQVCLRNLTASLDSTVMSTLQMATSFAGRSEYVQGR